MDFGSAVRVLLRHWLVVSLSLLVVVGALGYIFVVVPPTYTATTSGVLLVPNDPRSTDSGRLNPYLGFGGSLQVVAEITARAMNDKPEVAALSAEGARAD